MSVAGGALQVSAPSAQSSASVPGSATSAGASRTIANLLHDLDGDLSDTELVGLALENPKMKQQRMMNLITALSDEAIAGPRKEPHRHPWTTDGASARLVQAAGLCSRAVYSDDSSQFLHDLPDHVMKEAFRTEPSQSGRDKAAVVFEVHKTEAAQPQDQSIALVVAIRGSVSGIDWLVNLNSQAVTAPDLLNFPNALTPPLVHRGYVDCARALMPALEKQMISIMDKLQGRKVDLVFTGHSAGGAVATLLYCCFRTRPPPAIFSLSNRPSLSCITFGAPPIFASDVNMLLGELKCDKHSPYAKCTALAFVAEGDPVPRMDADYAARLAWLYHRVGSTSVFMAEIGKFRPLLLSLYGLGTMVMLYDANESSEELQLKATIIDRYYLHTCAWGNIFAHKMNYTYLAWTSHLGTGQFNGRKGHKTSIRHGLLSKVLPTSK